MVNLLLALIYLAFISLGLPDAVLGSAWPVASETLGVPISYMGIVTVIISCGTIFSTMQSDRLIRKMGIHALTAVSIGLTAVALLGFSLSNSFVTICLFAIPYGLGAGSVDAALNNYVAVNYESRHMSWLHCMWGVGATTGPYIMGSVLTRGANWNFGYTLLFAIQAVLVVVVAVSRPMWKKQSTEQTQKEKVLGVRELVKIPGVIFGMTTFFCFLALEQTAGIWASSFLVMNRGVSTDMAATFTAMFYLGITIGRGISGFITMKFTDTQMIRVGEVIILVGIAMIFIPNQFCAVAGLLIAGLGCAPVFPCMIHATPKNFGEKNSQAVIGIQMSCAYTGILIMPSVFGFLARYLSMNLYPFYLILIAGTMALCYEVLLKKVKK